jgi:hypothetical protein
LHNVGWSCSLNATFNSTDAVRGEKCWQLTVDWLFTHST